ncbi:hypothetical protein [Geodermatophilus maliterrae]|uniref:Uncharacterized protein n=1 Tax=Geodermatophilus maliterrae TaxID=3162531 RepID=A0ABV3XEQ2_9ACTN
MPETSPRTVLPLACTLGPEDGRDRLSRWEALHRTAVPAVHVADGELRVSYPGGPGVTEELRSLAAAEATCCAFVTWDVTEEAGRAVLTVRAPAGAPEAIGPIAVLFSAPA